MKSNIFPALKLTLCCILLLAVLYPLAMLGIGKMATPNNGRGETVQQNGRAVGCSRRIVVLKNPELQDIHNQHSKPSKPF